MRQEGRVYPHNNYDYWFKIISAGIIRTWEFKIFNRKYDITLILANNSEEKRYKCITFSFIITKTREIR